MENSAIRVLSVLPLDQNQLEKLQAVSPRLVVEQVIAPPEEVLTPQTQVLLTHEGNFSLKKAARLDWVQFDSAGVNHLHSSELWRSPIKLTSANGVHAVQIAEHILQMLLALGH